MSGSSDQATPKRPRQYAQEILRAPDREARLELLLEVPAHLRQWVETLVRIQFERRAA